MSVQHIVRGVGVVLVLALAATGWAQVQPPGLQRRVDPQAAARYQIAVMEGILETAVQRGARAITREWRAISPDMMMLSGSARARGFRLDGYGLFFDVEVPNLGQTMLWSWSILNRDNSGVSDAIQALRELIRTVSDPAIKQRFESNLKRLEAQVGPIPKYTDAARTPSLVNPQGGELPTQVAGRTSAPATGANVNSLSDLAMMDPQVAYTTEVTNALVDAILTYSNSLPIEHDEWLTVAARNGGDRRLDAADPYQYGAIQIRIKGSDVLALKAGKITRDEARKKVEIKEF